MSVRRVLGALFASALLIQLVVPAAQADDVVTKGLGGVWTPQGPSPVLGGQVENVTPNNEVDGAVHAVAAHPTDPDVLYVGAVNGGIWKTTNATALQPTWKAQTDPGPSNSIGALEFDPTDSHHRTLWAGIGLFSSFAREGGARTGLLKTTNGGNLWTPVTGGGTLLNKNVAGVAARGQTVVVAINFANPFTFGNIGIWRSTNGGASFTQIAVGDGTATGLPGGVTHDLVGDPQNPARLFTSVVFADGVGGQNGVYRSDDTGATWTKVSSPAMDTLILSNNITVNVEFAVGNHDNVYAAIANSGRLAGLFRSGDGGATWTALDLPQTTEAGGALFGIHPGGQASIHLSIAADPGNANVVYLGGDRQPFFTEGGGPGPFFPNSIGARNFSGRLFRVDASQPPGSQAVHLTHRTDLGAPGGGTASNSSPHADSREMTFDAAGNLIETDDGGVYRRTSPGDNTGDWFSLNGDLQVTEIHDHAYDAVSDILSSGNQDNGTTMQNTAQSLDWFLLLSGDGGDAAVDDKTFAGSGVSVRYSSAQGLGNFVRTFWDINNNFLGFVFPNLTVLNGGNPIAGQFTTPFVVNEVQPTRLLIAGGNSLYETLDQGDTVTEIGPGVVSVGTGRNPLAYGHPDDPDAIYAGNIDSMVVRLGGLAQPLVPRPSFPGTGSGFTIRGVAIDPVDVNTAYVANAVGVFVTSDGGVTWSDVTGNLGNLALLFLRGLVFVPRADDDDPGKRNGVLVVSASNGVFYSREQSGFSVWKPLGAGLPTVGVYDLDYDALTDTLTAGSLGRGAWRIDMVAVDD